MKSERKNLQGGHSEPLVPPGPSPGRESPGDLSPADYPGDSHPRKGNPGVNSQGETSLALPRPRSLGADKHRRVVRLPGDLGFFRHLLDLPAHPPVLRRLHDGRRRAHPEQFLRFFYGPLLPEIPDQLHSPGRGDGRHHLHPGDYHRLPSPALRFSGEKSFFFSDHRPHDHAPAGRGDGVCLHHGPGRDRERDPHGLPGFREADKLHVRHSRGPSGRNASSLSRS